MFCVSTANIHQFSIVDRLRVGSTDIRGTYLKGVPREQTMLMGHLPRVIYHQVYKSTKIARTTPFASALVSNFVWALLFTRN